jgi:long-chain acyl-CoA synthetase
MSGTPTDLSGSTYWPEDVPRSVAYPEIPVFGILTAAAQRQPSKPAAFQGPRSLTYAELDDLSNRLAAALAEDGVRKGDRVMLCLGNCLEFVVAYYGILKAGAVVVSASPMHRELELANQANDCGAETIVFGDELQSNVQPAAMASPLKRLISVGEASLPGARGLNELLSQRAQRPPRVSLDPAQDLATIQYTGGTTGVPKGAMITHRNLVCNAVMNALWFGWSNQERVVGVTPFFHTWGPTVCLNSVFHAGGSVYIMPRFDPEASLELIARERLTTFYAVTSLWQMLIDHPATRRHDLSSLRYVKAGGMPVLQEVKTAWERLTGVPLIPGYGLTEASPECMNNPLQRVKVGTIGLPIMDTTAKIADVERGTDLGSGEVGELVIKGPQVMKGYWNKPEETSHTLERGWLHTGDVMFRDEEGYYHFVERMKDMIKYKGHGVYPAELEDLLIQHPGVRECGVVGRQHPVAGEIPVAFIVRNEGTEVTAEELVEFCSDRISPYKKIREVRFVDELPKTPVGKLLKRQLRTLL